MVFSLPEEDPNYMPVTRDLSPAKRALILRWLETAAEPALGAAPPEWKIVKMRTAAPRALVQMQATSPGARSTVPPADDLGGKGEAAARIISGYEETHR
jgi:hypothetical protein